MPYVEVVHNFGQNLFHMAGNRGMAIRYECLNFDTTAQQELHTLLEAHKLHCRAESEKGLLYTYKVICDRSFLHCLSETKTNMVNLVIESFYLCTVKVIYRHKSTGTYVYIWQFISRYFGLMRKPWPWKTKDQIKHLVFLFSISLNPDHWTKKFIFDLTWLSAKWRIIGTVQQKIVYAPNFALCPILSWWPSPAKMTPPLIAFTFSNRFAWYLFLYKWKVGKSLLWNRVLHIQ